MSIPPVPNHPPRPGRRKPAEESPESITTQLFIGQDKSPTADGATQALSPEELARLRSMVSSDGVEATEVLRLEELRQLAAAEDDESSAGDEKPRKVKSEDIAEAEAASAPKQWNPQGGPPQRAPNPEPWGSDFGAPGPPVAGGPAAAGGPAGGPPAGGPAAAAAQAPQRPNPHSRPVAHTGNEPHVPNGASAYDPHTAAYAGHSAPAGGPYGPGGGFGPGGPSGPGGPGGPTGPGGPYRREPETKKVPGWLWALASIALVAVLAIVGYIAWDSTQGNEETASGTSSQEPSDGAGAETEGPASSSPPAAVESFKSPSGNIACTIDSERARCVISSYDYKAPDKPDECQLDEWGAIVVANTEGAGFSCRQAPDSSGPARVLGYGESITAEGMTCTSTREGMTCESDDSGVGFTIRRASVDFLD
ncbi:DUF6636 domain-containing protein [Brevibacterium marinum]|uniref:Uncharacterized protein n=1 Tax=Brevibacterium marinum TaxID=418643 RepID=A0A846S597_9MICO|nr:DUF6636 domain-containing protein [Brevibacterium marinum]NJC57251.1 hypothetical protein [Brevibacterium marinum]